MAGRTRSIVCLLTSAVALAGMIVPGAVARSLRCETEQARYNRIHAQVVRLQTRVEHDGSGGVTPKIFIGDLHRLQQAKLRQQAAAQALQHCKQ